MNNIEQRIRELAHQIWESEGQPDDQADRHWQMATQLAQSEQQGDLQPLPVKKSNRKPRTKVAAAPANDQTQREKPALLDKPAGAGKATRAKRQPIARTTKLTDLGKPDNGSQE